MTSQVISREVTILIGQNGWDLERFGTEATILRARRSESTGANRSGLLLSCAGADKRLRLTLPEAIVTLPGSSTSGLLLMRSEGLATTARVTVQDSTVTSSDQQIIDLVLKQLRASVNAPRAFSLLLNIGANPITLGRSTAFHLTFASGSVDTPAFRDAVEACGLDREFSPRRRSEENRAIIR